jgi:hypothetical protein
MVAKRGGDISEFLEDEVTGILVELDNPETPASAITRLLGFPAEADDPGTRARSSFESRGATLRYNLAALSDLYLRLAHFTKMQPGSRLEARTHLAIRVNRNLRLWNPGDSGGSSASSRDLRKLASTWGTFPPRTRGVGVESS